MYRKNAYTSGRFKPRENEIVLKEDFDFEKHPECKIFNINVHDIDFKKTAFLTNFKTVNIKDEDNLERTCLMCVFLDQQGEWLTCYFQQDPYFLVKCREGFENEVLSYLERKFEGDFSSLKIIDKVDLQEVNHLSGKQRKYIKLSFFTLGTMNYVRKCLEKSIQEFARKYKPKRRKLDKETVQDIFEVIEDLYEYDILYSARVCIDNEIRVAFWYSIVVRKGFMVKFERKEEILEKPDFSILAFDIETSKAPLKFPDPDTDSIMLISYTIDEETFLIVNREIISKDIESFEYNPKKNISQKVKIFNEKDEKQSIQRFYTHIKQLKPFLIVTFNGDFFDIPFIQKRAKIYDLEIEKELGWVEDRNKYSGQFVFSHIDCFYWVKRDAFLPHGSHGLKNVTRIKLGYDPIEIDHEQIVNMARNNPQQLCEYSVSDAVATYYLYIKHIHDYIFALCTILPLNPDDILRRGSGTLCENLLMARAFKNNIVFPNRQRKREDKYYKGKLIENETYVGGYVECLNNGIYRADIATDFELKTSAYEDLIGKTQKILEFCVEIENGENLNDVENLKEVKEEIQNKLSNIMKKIEVNEEKPFEMLPLIYHVDVSSMYPNIILTNRLQPTAIVNNRICSNCLFNESRNNCKKNLGWDYKANYYPLTQPEYEKLKLENSQKILKQKIKTYCQKNYKSYHKTIIEYKEDTVCMRENPFYVDTIRDFRDLRYKYKNLAKKYFGQKKNYEQNGDENKANEAQMLSVLYNSLQLAHKIILNSFYGYVMKRGARWYSMEMAAMVTYTGAKIIQESKYMMDQIGKPLELDTDGIWTLLPENFPENFEILTKQKKKLSFSFPCSLMNWLIYDKFKNSQYQSLVNAEEHSYKTRTEMSIFFEIDGPYKAMVIPAAREENKKLKKRYAVFNFKNEITEIKGFEIKRRGELGIVRIFQKEIFNQFLKGHDLKSLYGACALTCKKWLDVILQKGKGMSDDKIFELFAQVKVLSRQIKDYANKKNIAITAALRLSELLNNPIEDTSGLSCTFIVSRKPINEQLNQRAIPISLFKLEKKKQQEFLRKWLKMEDASKETLVSIIDWDYYYERFVHILQKVVLIPAVLQGIDNPLPEVNCPDWLQKRLNDNNQHKQTGLKRFFEIQPKTVEDIKNMFLNSNKKKRKKIEIEEDDDKVKKNEKSEKMEIENVENEFKSLRLSLLKKKWQNMRKKQKNDSIDKIQMQSSNLQTFAQTIEKRVKSSTWQLIKISQHKNYLKFWIMIDRKVLAFKNIHSYKTIYVNSLKEEPTGKLVLSKKKLPREKEAYFLYEYKIAEEDFQTKLSNLDYYLTNPDIEGVYQTQIDLCFQAFVNCTNRCRLKRQFINQKDIEMEYLEPEKNNQKLSLLQNNIFGKIKLLFAWVVEIKRKYYAIVFTEERISVIKCFQQKENKNSQAVYKNFVSETLLKVFEDVSEYEPEIVQIDYYPVQTYEQFLHHIISIISNYRMELKYSPNITVIKHNIAKLQDSLKSFENEFPVLYLKENKIDDISFSSLDWHLKFAEVGILRFKDIQAEILIYDELAAFAELPLCNLGYTLEQSIILAIDTMFARGLDESYCVWWFSHSGQPDLGTKNNTFSNDGLFQQFALNCETTIATISETYVIEIDLKLFHFNCLIISEIFKNFNNEMLMVQPKKKRVHKRDKLLEQFTINNKVGFNIIKSLFLKWYKEVIMNQNKVADLILQNLVRWMCSEDSFFYDPYLKLMFDKIVKNVFEEFQDCLEGLGARIIYANPYKLFIQTQRSSFGSAINFVQFVLESVIENEKFSYLQMEIRRVYKNLFFYDLYNFSGVVVTLDPSQSQKVVENEVNKNLSVFSRWKMIEIFPQSVQEHFELVVYDIVAKYTEILLQNQKENKKQIYELNKPFVFDKMNDYLFNEFSSKIYDLLNYIKEQQRLFEYNQYEAQKKGESVNPSQMDIEQSLDEKSQSYYKENDEEEEDDYEQDSFLVDDMNDEEDKINKKVLVKRRRKRKRKRKQSESEQDQQSKIQWRFSDIPGKQLKTNNIVLEFVKILFELLTREKHFLRDLFNNLKDELLQFIHVSKYEDEANFKPVFLSFPLMNIICKKCYIVRNIDLFLDYVNKEKCFKCICGEKYDKFNIEEKIIKSLKECFHYYLVQKQYCKDCKSLKEDYLGRTCFCGGRFFVEKNVLLENYFEEAKNGFVNFKNLAAECDFYYLKDYLVDLSC